MAGSHDTGSNCDRCAASVVLQSFTSNASIRDTLVRPSSKPSLNCSCDVPKAETMPIPETFTGRRTPGRLPWVMRLSSIAHALVVACAALAVIALAATTSFGQAARKVATSRPGEQSFEDLYRRGHQTSAGITTLTARFTESTTSALLAVPLVAHGTLAVHRPSRVALRYAAPEHRVIVIDGDTMTSAWPSRNLRQVLDIGRTQRRIQQYLTSDSTVELRRQFAIDLRWDTERHGCFEVVLTPKRTRIRETLTAPDTLGRSHIVSPQRDSYDICERGYQDDGFPRCQTQPFPRGTNFQSRALKVDVTG